MISDSLFYIYPVFNCKQSIPCHPHACPSLLPKAKALKIQRENKGEGAALFCCSQPLSVTSSTTCLLKRHSPALSPVHDNFASCSVPGASAPLPWSPAGPKDALPWRWVTGRMLHPF